MSTLTCPKCQAGNPPTARFCTACGSLLAATTTQGRTVVMSPTTTSSTIRGFDARTVSQRALAAFGPNSGAVGPRTMLDPGYRQREHLWLVDDTSGSMDLPFGPGVTKMEASIQAGVNLILNKDRIDPDDHVGLITFESSAQVRYELGPLSTNKTKLIECIQRLQPGGGTNIDKGLRAAFKGFDWSARNVVRRIVLKTDGRSDEILDTAEELKSRGAIIDVIGIGPSPGDVNEGYLKKIASVVQGELRYQFIQDQRTLVNYYTQLGNKTATGA